MLRLLKPVFPGQRLFDSGKKSVFRDEPLRGRLPVLAEFVFQRAPSGDPKPAFGAEHANQIEQRGPVGGDMVDDEICEDAFKRCGWEGKIWKSCRGQTEPTLAAGHLKHSQGRIYTHDNGPGRGEFQSHATRDSSARAGIQYPAGVGEADVRYKIGRGMFEDAGGGEAAVSGRGRIVGSPGVRHISFMR